MEKNRHNKNLLVELFVEELPPKALNKLGDSFASVLFQTLKLQGLTFDNSAVTAFATPRRLAAHVSYVADKAVDKQISQKLMPTSVGLDTSGKATPALLKKLQSLGADESAVASLKNENNTLFLDALQDGVTLQDGLQKALDEALAKLPIPKVMTYQLADGWSSVNFVRPAHGLVAMHGSSVISINALGLQSSNTTSGHRFEAKNEKITLNHADTYAEQLLTEGAVIASFAARKAEITNQLNAAAAKENLKPIDDGALLDEVTALVERPNVLLGQFEKEYLEVPQECLILTMKANQKYFPLLDANNKLTNKFLIVSNISPKDPSKVIGGNERVVRPRLADAKFFFDQDRKKTLESRVTGLYKVVYHNKLGSQGERNLRVQKIGADIATQLGIAEQTSDFELGRKVNIAATLSKTDLLTDMVGEFPELQGIMGRYYAQHEALDDEVAFAIEDHYKPRFAGDVLPRSQVGICVALADKLETLVGMFGIGNVPTGDKDPFALRRHSLGILRMLTTLNLDVEWLIKKTIEAFPSGLLQLEFDDGELAIPLWIKVKIFLDERASSYLKDLGYSPQEAQAIIFQANPYEFIPRLEAIRKAQATFPGEFSQLANADKRARNIINKSGMPSEVLMADRNLCIEAAEFTLFDKTRELRGQINHLVDEGRFDEALLLALHISNPVTAFFDSVMVNADRDNIRLNRFRLLHEVTGLTNRVADISKLAS